MHGGAYLKIYRGGAYRKVSGYINIYFVIGAHNAWWGGAPIAKYIWGAPIAKDLGRCHNLSVLIDGGGAYGIGDIRAHNTWGRL